MVNHAQPDDPRLPDQSAYPRLNWYNSCTKLSLGDDEWNKFPDPPVVPFEDWPDRLNADIANITMVGRMRAVNDVGVSGKQFLQLNRYGLLRLSDIWHGRNADLRGLRECNSLLQSLLWGILSRQRRQDAASDLL